MPQFGEIHEAVETQFAGAPDRIRFLESLRGLIDVLVSGLILGVAGSVERAGVKTTQDVREHPGRLAHLLPEAAATNAALKSFLHERVYFSPSLSAERKLGAVRIAELFEFFMREPGQLPEGYAESGEPLHRVVCDYIAGMTDGYFRRIYASRCAT